MMQNKQNSLNKRLKTYFIHSIVTFVVIVTFLLILISIIGNSYNQIVLNITKANENILTFKHDVDYALYRTVIGSANNWDTTFDKDIKDPYKTIDNMKNNMIMLKSMTNDKDNYTRIENIIKRLDSLRNMADTLYDRSQKKGFYDENMNFLELNVYILTELITNQVHEYVYYEAAHLELVRKRLETTLLVTIIVGLLALFVSLIHLRHMNNKIKESVLIPIQDICNATSEIGKGEFINISDEKYDYEVAILSSSVNKMSKEIKRLLEKTKSEQEQLRLRELQLYQAQIKPHFLYNTLDTIMALVESKRNEDAILLIEQLSSFFRTTLSGGRAKITIKEEIEHVKSYLQIQQIRYQDIMEFKIDVPFSLYDYLIIKLTLQPLVENALYHGIKQRRGKGLITIRGLEINSDEIEFQVIDNGIGMDEEKLNGINRIIENKKPVSNEIFCLRNVNQRIKLNYGSKYGLRIESKKNLGTTVFVRLPKDI